MIFTHLRYVQAFALKFVRINFSDKGGNCGEVEGRVNFKLLFCGELSEETAKLSELGDGVDWRIM
jgi:hypothetical protein